MSRKRTRETHLCFCLSVNPDHILSAGGPYKGAGLLVFFHCTVDGLLQSCWAHCAPLCICCVYHSAVCYLQKPQIILGNTGSNGTNSMSVQT